MKMYFIIIWYQKQGNDSIHDGDKGIGVKAIVFIMIWFNGNTISPWWPYYGIIIGYNNLASYDNDEDDDDDSCGGDWDMKATQWRELEQGFQPRQPARDDENFHQAFGVFESELL